MLVIKQTELTAATDWLVALVDAVRVTVTVLGCGDARSVGTSELRDAAVLLLLLLLLMLVRMLLRVLLAARTAERFRAVCCGSVH